MNACLPRGENKRMIGMVQEQTADEPLTCPYCGDQMLKGYFLIGGGVWFGESRVASEPLISGDAGIGEVLTPPIHVLAMGFKRKPQGWPKPG